MTPGTYRLRVRVSEPGTPFEAVNEVFVSNRLTVEVATPRD